MTTVAKLTSDGELKLTGNIDTRLPLVTDGLVAHYPMDGVVDKYFPTSIRYVRCWRNGNTINTSNHYHEITVMDYDGVNRALGLTVTGSVSITNAHHITDGDSDSIGNYTYQISPLQYVQLDLLAEYTIKEIGVWGYYDDGRTCHETKVEVSDDGILWHAIFDSAIEGEYVETPAGKIHDLENLGTTVKPLNDVSTTKTFDGVAVDKGTTNIIPNHPDANVGYSIDIVEDIDKLYNGSRVDKWSRTATGTAYKGWRFNTVLGVTYTGSVYIFDPYNKFQSCSLYDDSAQFTDRVAGAKDLGDGWVRHWFTATAAETAISSHGFIIYSGAPTVGEHFWISQPQIEIGEYPTGFVNGTRDADWRLSLPFTLQPPYTINLTHTPSVPLSSIVDQASSPIILQLGEYYDNASVTVWNHIGAFRMFVKGDTGAGWTATGTAYPYTDLTWNNITHTYTLVAEDDRVFSLYMDGLHVDTKSGSVDVTNITALDLGYGNGANGIYKDLSIYDRHLSDDEIKLLTDGTHSITENNLITKSVQTENKLDGVHFPFSVDSKNFYKDVVPVKEENTTYDDGVFIGSGTTNLLDGDSWNLDWFGRPDHFESMTRTKEPYEIIEGCAVGKGVINGPDNSLFCYFDTPLPTGTTAGVVYTCSYYVKSSDRVADVWVHDSLAGPSSVNSPVSVADGTWQRLSVQFISTTTGVVRYHFSVGAGATGDVVYITAPQIEQTSYVTPYVNGTRDGGSLQLPYDIIDLKIDFTIYGWMKPVENIDGYQALVTRNNLIGNYTNHRFLIMTESTGSANFALWFSSGGSGDFLVEPSRDIIPNEYMFLCCKREGPTISLHVGNSTGYNKVSKAVGTYLDADETGQVWHVGDYNDSYKSDSYHRDLVFYQGAISDDDIEMMFKAKTKMKASKDGLIIQNGISSGNIL